MDHQVPRMYSCVPHTPPIQDKGHKKEAGESPAHASAGPGTNDPSVTLAALMGRELGSSPRTPEVLGVL